MSALFTIKLLGCTSKEHTYTYIHSCCVPLPGRADKWMKFMALYFEMTFRARVFYCLQTAGSPFFTIFRSIFLFFFQREPKEVKDWVAMIYKLMSARNVARAPVQRLLSYFYYKACSIKRTLLQIFKSSLLNVPLNHKKSRVKMNVPFSINSTLLKFFWTDTVAKKGIMVKSVKNYWYSNRILLKCMHIIKY